MAAHGNLLGVTAVVWLATFGHALVTWPLPTVGVLFGLGAAITFVAEVVVVRLGWLEHHVDPAIMRAPLFVVAGWTAVIYMAFWSAASLTSGLLVPLLAGTFATGFDLLMDPRGVAVGLWTYTDEVPGPRPRGVPWWNYVGWFVLKTMVTSLAILVV